MPLPFFYRGSVRRCSSRSADAAPDLPMRLPVCRCGSRFADAAPDLPMRLPICRCSSDLPAPDPPMAPDLSMRLPTRRIDARRFGVYMVPGIKPRN